MWRGAELEGVQQEAELLLGLLGVDAHDLEHPFLDVTAVDTDGATADLVAVADEVVGIGQGRSRIGVEGVDAAGGGAGEGVVHRGPCPVADGHVARALGLLGRLEQWGVDDPAERPVTRFVEVTALADLQAGCAEQFLGGGTGTGGEEDRVSGVGPDLPCDSGLLGLGDVLGDRATQCAVLGHRDVGKTLGAAGTGPLLPGVELATWLGGTARHDDGTDVGRLEHPERGVGEEVGDLGDLVAESQVGLVGAETVHGVVPGDALQRGLNVHSDELPALPHDLLGQGNDVVLLDEAHLDVELGELGLAIGAEVLVTVASRDLVVTLHAGDHEQLLEQLGALWQGVPAARGQTGRYQEVTSPLRGGAGEGRCLDVVEVVAVQHLANLVRHLGAQHQGLVLTWTTQVEVTILETGVLTDVDVLVDLERQGCRRVEHLEGGDVHLDLTRRQVRVRIALRTCLDDAGDADAELVAQVMGT